MGTHPYANSLIYKRHSARKYTNEPVDNVRLEHILRAGMAGPSAHNAQPWSFVVIDDRKLLDEIANFHPYAKMLYEAPVAILVCAIREVVEKNPFYQQDMGAAVENMLLAATECGVGSCWCGVHPREQLEGFFLELLSMPKTLLPFAIVALGCLRSEPVSSDRYDASRVYRNAW